MDKIPLERQPGGKGDGPQFIVPRVKKKKISDQGEKIVEDAVKGDLPPTTPGGQGDGPLFKGKS